MMAKSDFILGRQKSLAAFTAGGPFKVSAYWCASVGKMRYTDPLKSSKSPGRERWGRQSCVRYIIRVIPK